MNNSEKIERLREIAERGAAKLKAADKAYITGLCADYGVEINPYTNCKQCFIDATVALVAKMKAEDADEQPATGYVLKEGVNLRMVGKNNFEINAATLTDENARKWIAAGLSLKYFAHVPDED